MTNRMMNCRVTDGELGNIYLTFGHASNTQLLNKLISLKQCAIGKWCLLGDFNALCKPGEVHCTG